MKTAFVLFDGMTSLDLVGVLDPVSRLRTTGFVPDLEIDLCAAAIPVSDSNHLAFQVTSTGETLGGRDLVVVPGGPGTRALMRDASFLDWLRTASDCPLLASVCTGSLLLGAAGFLDGRAATTHSSAMGLLEGMSAEVLEERIVDTGGVITAAGVSASIDLGLYLCERLAGLEARLRVAERIEYAHYDPGCVAVRAG